MLFSFRLPCKPAGRLFSRSFQDFYPKKTVMAAQYSNGSRQSPIDIESGKAFTDKDLASRPLQFSNHKSIFSLTKTGSTMDAKTPKEYLLSGGPLENPYSLLGFHFHWENQHDHTAGSEHKLNGKAFASELHIVHMNHLKYQTFNDALQHGDGLSVLGVFLELASDGQGHEGLETLCGAFDQIQLKGSSTELKTQYSPYSLLPADTTSYWTYPGSLTTSPFSECVTWIVFKDSIKVSKRQLEKFRSLATATAEEAHGVAQSDLPHICHNVRDTFPLGDRVLKASF